MGFPVKPSGYVGWCSTGATNVTEPIDSKKAVGWAGNEAPPSSYVNWIQQKQDQWIQYLDWRSSLTPLVRDDFVVGDTITANGGNGVGFTTGYYGPWYYERIVWAHQGGVVGVLGGVGNYQQPLMGVLYGGNPSGWYEARVNVGNLTTRDMRMEFAAMFLSKDSQSQISWELGIMFAHSGMSGGNLLCGFMATGSSGNLGFRWVPSGQNATSVSLGQIPSGMSGLHKYVSECRGPTNAIYVDDVLVTAVPVPGPIGASGPVDLHFGGRFGVASGVKQLVLDYAELSVKRSPL